MDVKDEEICTSGDKMDPELCKRYKSTSDTGSIEPLQFTEMIEIAATESHPVIYESNSSETKTGVKDYGKGSSALDNYLQCSEMLMAAPLIEIKSRTQSTTDQSDKSQVFSSDLSPDSFKSISVETREEVVDNGISNYQIDYSAIQDYVIGEPIIVYHFGKISLKCTKLNSKVYIRSFPCSSLGLCDREALSKVQEFVNTKLCIRKLAIVEELNAENIADLVSDIKLSKLADSSVRLICTFHTGGTKTKIFPGTELGIKDPGTRRTIQAFIDSEEGRNWVVNGSRKGQSQGWIKVGEVPTGKDTMNFISNHIKFDMKQKFFYNKKFLEVHRNEDVLAASVSSHENWGTTHRADDLFILKVPPQTVAKTVVAHYRLYCASLTAKCKTSCGMPITDVAIINDKFSCCGMTKERQTCENCLIDNTSQWYKIDNGFVLCNSCYKFYQRRGVHRSYRKTYDKKERIHESHAKCKWKMKLELRGNDVTKWVVYDHSDNDKDHEFKMPCQTRPTLPMRDKWDKLRSLAKLTPKQILLSESHLRNEMPEIQRKMNMNTLKSIRTRAKVMDSRKKTTMISIQNGVPMTTKKRISRITVEKTCEHVILMNRERKGVKKEYHLIICPADSIENLMDLEIPLVDDIGLSRFKKGIIVIYYNPFENNRSVAAGFLISYMEGDFKLAISHEIFFKVSDNEQLATVLQQEKQSNCHFNFNPVNVIKSTPKVRKRKTRSPSIYDFSNIMDLVTESPRVVKLSKMRVRLQCTIPGGKYITKIFPCSELGLQDTQMQGAIQEFLNNQMCRDWLQRKDGDPWIRLGEVATGKDTEQYLHHLIKFEVKQRFFYRKEFLNISHDGDTMLSDWNKNGGNKSHGRSGIHKVGNKFSLKVPPEEVGNKVIATMYIDCASTSEFCKTKCGVVAKNVYVVDNIFSCCGVSRDAVTICCNCYTDNSDRWSKFSDDNFLCHTCHNYFRKNNRNRPISTSKTKTKKIHESHILCKWKMKLELRAPDVRRWQVFKLNLNKDAHEEIAPLKPSKRKADNIHPKKLHKRMKLFDEKYDASTNKCTNIIKGFPKFTVGSDGHPFKHIEKPDQIGFMYPEIKDYITHLMSKDIICPKEIRLYVTQYIRENFNVIERRDNKCDQNAIRELRTLLKGFIYYVESDVDANSNHHQSNLTIWLGAGYPTLYFVQEEQDEDDNQDDTTIEIIDMENDNYLENVTDFQPSEYNTSHLSFGAVKDRCLNNDSGVEIDNCRKSNENCVSVECAHVDIMVQNVNRECTDIESIVLKREFDVNKNHDQVLEINEDCSVNFIETESEIFQGSLPSQNHEDDCLVKVTSSSESKPLKIKTSGSEPPLKIFTTSRNCNAWLI